MARRDPPDQVSLIKKAKSMKKLRRLSRLPLSKHEQRGLNRSNEETSWDSAVLSMELGELKGLGFDMTMTGLSIGELNNLVPAAAGLTEDDAVPAPPDTPVTVLGDCWLCGPHRVLCGDSTSVDAVARLCAPGLANLVFTDPPYNVDYGAGRRQKA